VFKLPELPYGYDALEPTVSAETMRFHHDKHHARYVQVTNEICQQDGLRPASLEELVVKAKRDGNKKLYNNAAQVWNHTFFWDCMTPGAKPPQGALAEAVGKAFGGVDKLREKFVAEGAAHFGSGWVWLCANGSSLEVVSTHDGENLLDRQGVVPLTVCDLWEHAYYVDYRNDRKGFLEAWFDKVANWELAGRQFAAAQGQGQAWRHPEPAHEPA
jgi:Fe-Mn family superoxide dismutase